MAGLAGVQNQVTIDPDVFDPFRKLNGVDKGSLVEDSVGVEDDDVREVAGLQEATTLEAEDFGWLGGHLANRVLKRQRLLIANVLAEDPWERSEDTPVRLAAHDALRLLFAAQKPIGADILFRPGEEADDVLFPAIEVDHADCVFLSEEKIKRCIVRVGVADLGDLPEALADEVLIHVCLYAGDEDLVEAGEVDEVVPAGYAALDVVNHALAKLGAAQALKEFDDIERGIPGWDN